MTKKKELTPEQIERLQLAEERKQRNQKRRLDKQEYLDLIDRQIDLSFPSLQFISEQLKTVKKGVYLNFQAAIQLKKEMFGERIDQNQTHTFTHSDGKRRIMLITYFIDDWDDTITSGLDLVKQRLEAYSVDENSSSLVKQLLRLISKNSKGELKVSSVLQFRRFAEERNDEALIDAVSLIEQAYRPTFSKTSIRVEIKNEQGAWVNVPLSATEA